MTSWRASSPAGSRLNGACHAAGAAASWSAFGALAATIRTFRRIAYANTASGRRLQRALGTADNRFNSWEETRTVLLVAACTQ